MEIKSRKNAHNFDVADCPFCEYFAYIRPVTKASPDPLRDLKRHITNQAKNEALAHLIGDLNTMEILHFDYYKVHTQTKRIVSSVEKRQYDEDLKLKI